MITSKDFLRNFIEKCASDFTSVSDEIWDYAETAFRERRSSTRQIELLKQFGFRVTGHTAGIETAFTAEWGKGAPVIAFLGEFDALAGLSQLPGITHCEALHEGGAGHGCGHNLLGVGAIAAAASLKALMESEGLPGTIRYYGCPGEEGGSGKAFMAREGVFSDVDAALTWHPGTLNALYNSSSLANNQIYYRFRGIPSHAAAAPHLGRSALDAVTLMNVGVQFLREHVTDDVRIHYAVTDTGGFSPNVVQGHAEALYLIRASDSSTLAEVTERVNRIASGAALMTDTSLEKDFVKSCSELINNTVLERALYKNMENCGAPDFSEDEKDFAAKLFRTTPETGRFQEIGVRTAELGEQGSSLYKTLENEALSTTVIPYVTPGTPLPGSTDVGDVSWQTPTAQFQLAAWPNSTPGHSWQAVTVGKSSFAHKAMLRAALILSKTGHDLLTSPALLKAAKQEHEKRLEGKKYIPIPKGVTPRAISKEK